MKKIIAILIVNLFLLSIIPAQIFADEDEITNRETANTSKECERLFNMVNILLNSEGTLKCGDRLYEKYLDVNNDGLIIAQDALIIANNKDNSEWCAKQLKDTTNPCEKKLGEKRENIQERKIEVMDSCLEKCVNKGTNKEKCREICKPKVITTARPIIKNKLGNCIEGLTEKYPDVSKEDIVRKCEYRTLNIIKPSEKLERVREFQKEEFREFQKEKLMLAIDKCKEQGLDSELCEKKFEMRVKLVDKLKEHDLERLRNIEERKIKKQKELRELNQKEEFLKYKKDNEYKARKIGQAKLIKAKENYLKAKEKYEQTKKNYINATVIFKEKKAKLKECNYNSTQECDQYEEEIKERAKDVLFKSIDQILNHLNKIKAKTGSNEDLSESEAAHIISEIDNMIRDFEDTKATVKESETKEDIIAASAMVKRAWLRIKGKLAIQTGRIVNARIGGIIVKIKQLEIKLERILGRMEEQSIDTSKIQTLIDEFNAKTDKAQINYGNALEKFKDAAFVENVETAHNLATEGHRYMKEAHKMLQEANKLLKKIILSIKQAGGEKELTATEDEVEEEVEGAEEVENETWEEDEETKESNEGSNETITKLESCGDGICQNVVCTAIGCPIAETAQNCPADCSIGNST